MSNGGNSPTPAAPPHRRMISVWACAVNALINVSDDARLRGGTEYVDRTYGQWGYDWGISFDSFTGLVNHLRTDKPPAFTCGNSAFRCDPLPDHGLRWLSINAHGLSGQVDINCKSSSPFGILPTGETDSLNVATLGKYHAEFAELDRLLAPGPDGVLFFMCCLTGQSIKGSEFLVEVSKLLPGREIMAISTIGYSEGGKQIRPGSQLDEPGMRDTNDYWPAPTVPLEAQRYDAIWNDLSALPWADRDSPHTKIARDGAIVGGRGKSL